MRRRGRAGGPTRGLHRCEPAQITRQTLRPLRWPAVATRSKAARLSRTASPRGRPWIVTPATARDCGAKLPGRGTIGTKPTAGHRDLCSADHNLQGAGTLLGGSKPLLKGARCNSYASGPKTDQLWWKTVYIGRGARRSAPSLQADVEARHLSSGATANSGPDQFG